MKTQRRAAWAKDKQISGNVASGANKHKYACGGTFGVETVQLLIVENMEFVTFVLLAFSPTWNTGR